MARKSNRKSKKSKNGLSRPNIIRRRWGQPPAMTNAGRLRKLFQWLFLNDGIFADLKLHGNTSWLPRSLVVLALCWSWSQNRFVTDAFADGVEWAQLIIGGVLPTTYQGFMLALVRWTGPILSVVWPVLHQRMEQIGGEFWRIGDWVAIAFDGSRSTAPRTKSNESAVRSDRWRNSHGRNHRNRSAV